MNEKIATIVVTYNRKKLLVECIEALKKQTYKINTIYIIDNNSTDGTYELLQEKGILDNEQIIYKKLSKNIGGAGGFYEGIKLAIKKQFDWIWVMDDDTIPYNDALENLLIVRKNIKEKIAFLSSSALNDKKDKYINHGKINLKSDKDGYFSYRKYLKYSALELESATFVACLINNNAIKECGLPVKDYFIWCDDIEYTKRLTTYYGKGYHIGKSEVIHKRKGKIVNSIKDEENVDKLKFWFYMLRNNLININEYYKSKIFINIIKYQILSIYCILNFNIKYGLKKFFIIHKAIFCFILKKYDYKAFKNRFDIDVKYKE